MHHLTLAALALVPALAGQQNAPPATSPATPFGGVHVADPTEDGTVWVRGHRYKLCFAAAGLTFLPLFGPKAARNFPVAFRLREARIGENSLLEPTRQPWQRRGHLFTRGHGGLQESWRAAADGAEQSFTVAQPRGTGPLELQIEVDTDLQADESGPGVRFHEARLGHVHYGDAIAIDASGKRLLLPVDWREGALHIVVPASFTASASWPVVIDPLVATFAIDTSVSDVQDARVACEPTTGNWLVVAEEHLSATDVDIVCYRYDNAATPSLLDTVFAESSTDRSNNPGLGFVAQTQQFIVMWHNATAGSFEWRTRSAGSTTMGITTSMSQGVGSNLDNRPMVGSTLAGDRFLSVLFRRGPSFSDILTTLSRSNGLNFDNLLLGPLLSPSSGTLVPGGVSVAANSADKWVVVWRECASASCASQQIRMQAVASTNGSAPLTREPVVALDSGDLVDSPDIAGHSGNLLAVWRASVGATAPRLRGVPIGVVGGSYGPVGGVQDLTVQEPGANNNRNKSNPTVSYDGCRFVYGYLEDDGTDLRYPHAATVLVTGSSIAWHEGHLPLATVAGFDCRSFDLGYGFAANFGHHWGVFEQDSPAFTGNVHAAIVDARHTGLTSVLTQTGCGVPNEPGIALAGTPALGRTFTVSLSGLNGLPFLLIGAQSTGTLQGCGTCMSGVQLPAAAVLVGTSSSITVPRDPAFLRFRLAFQGLDLGHLGGCPPPVYGADFALTDTIAIQIL
ncbi:MAG: hypothetical protein JNK49_03735 [Planctomycetes bacterium]|nr:hypothetical protein [Planctomycetota bacterium]